MIYTLWPKGPDVVNGKREVDEPWPSFVRWLSEPLVTDDRNEAGGWSSARFRLDHRKGANVSDVTSLVLDHDYGTCSIEQMSKLASAYRHAVHATYRCRPDFPRWRAVIATSRNMTPEEYGLVWRLVVRKLLKQGVKIDDKTKDSSRYWYAPCVSPGVRYQVLHADGATLDVDALLEYSRQQKSRVASTPATPRTVPSTVPRTGPRNVSGPKGEKYYRAIMRRSSDLVADAGEGERNAVLNREVYSVARFDQIQTHSIVSLMSEAAKYAGLDDEEIRRTINSALKARGR